MLLSVEHCVVSYIYNYWLDAVWNLVNIIYYVIILQAINWFSGMESWPSQINQEIPLINIRIHRPPQEMYRAEGKLSSKIFWLPYTFLKFSSILFECRHITKYNWILIVFSVSSCLSLAKWCSGKILWLWVCDTND